MFLIVLFFFLGLIDLLLWSNVKILRWSKNRDFFEMKECFICWVWMNKKNFVRYMYVYLDLWVFCCKICDKGFKIRLNFIRYEFIYIWDSVIWWK